MQIARQISAEEEELTVKRTECAALQAELADRELYLVNLRASISAFEGEFLRRVGTLYAELDVWNAKIAARVAEKEPTEEARSAAADAAARAEESRSAVQGEAAKAKEFNPSTELKSLYREVAKRIHPDLGTDEMDRLNRANYMAEVNCAYKQGDEDAMLWTLAEYESSPDVVQSSRVAADLVRVIRQTEQIRNRLAEIDQETLGLLDSDIAKLKAKADAASAEGRAPLAEMADAVSARLRAARLHYESVSA